MAVLLGCWRHYHAFAGVRKATNRLSYNAPFALWGDLMSNALIFPGQGSQSLGMLADLAVEYGDIVLEPFNTASNILGFVLWQLCQDGPEEKLNATENTQPALLTAGYAVWHVMRETLDVKTAMMAGHSLGEYTALVCSGALAFAEAVELVAFRGRVMQEAVAPGTGAMAAILGLPDGEVIAACEQAAAGETVSAVNFNSPGQVVIAGSIAAVDRAIDKAMERGAKKAIKLPVSVPSHCALMLSAAERLDEKLQSIDFNKSEVPVLHNVDVKKHEDAAGIRAALVAQLYNPVRWVETIEQIKANDVDTVIECGPGKVLTGLNKRIDRSINALPIYDTASLEKAKTVLGGK